jgi:hypothetical protein
MSSNWEIGFRESLEGISTPAMSQSVDTWIMVINIFCILACLSLLFLSARKFNTNNFNMSFAAFAGAAIAGSAPFIAPVFILS